MTNYRIIEDRAYEMAMDNLFEDVDTAIDYIADRLAETYGICAEEAYGIAQDAVYDTLCEEDGDWDREMGFDPYEGCYTWDC